MINIPEIKLVIDNNVLDKYKDFYFKKYPKRRKFPIDSPIAPSLNQWSVMVRLKANSVKQAWCEFVIWLVQENNLTNANISQCRIIATYYFKTKQRRDADNYTIKFIGDGLVKSGLLKDDDFTHVKELVIRGDYDKERPRTELLIEY